MTELELRAMRLWQILSEEANDFPLQRITRATRLLQDLNLSGVQRIALAYRIEQEFGVQFDEAGWDAVVLVGATVGGCLNALQRHITPEHA